MREGEAGEAGDGRGDDVTLPWFPVPRNAGLNSRVRGVSDAARGVWLLLLCGADDHGNITGAATQSYDDIVEAVAGIGSSVYLPELRSVALVLVDVGVQRLHLPDVTAWRAECTPGATVGVVMVAPAPSAPVAPGVAWSTSQAGCSDA